MRIPDEHKAKLFKVDQANPGNEPGATSADAVLVQFNPTSLAYSVQNTLEKKGRDANAKQFVAQTTAKLEFDLVFDSTHDGADVRGETDRIKQFLNPGDKSTNKDQAPALVGFRWGTYLFKGILESFKENLDFFSAEGVPLRSTLKIGLSSQDPKDVFAQLPAGHPDAAAAAGGGVSLAALGQRGTSGMAAQGGNAAAGRALAASNGFESMRNPGAGVAAVASGGVQLKAAVGFSAGASVSAGAGVGLGLGLGVGASAGTGASSLQAFAGLGSPKAATGAPALNTRALMPAAPSPGTALGSGFALGGQAVSASSSGMKADMGMSARIKFD